jgi:hypothetical protein
MLRAPVARDLTFGPLCISIKFFNEKYRKLISPGIFVLLHSNTAVIRSYFEQGESFDSRNLGLGLT